MRKIITLLAVVVVLSCASRLLAGEQISPADLEIYKDRLASMLLAMKNADATEYERLFPRVYTPFGYDLSRETAFNQFARVDLDNYYFVYYRVLSGGICISGSDCASSMEKAQNLVLISKKKGEPGITFFSLDRNNLFTNFSSSTYIFTGNVLNNLGLDTNKLISEVKLTDYLYNRNRSK
ncbi:MAG: hypothetical protein LBV23_10975 [Deltaproteobacteria bacterium]|jgi:hypothetical protein|nr:hypothetical protein [Deltaproteobacteria bacterium]